MSDIVRFTAITTMSGSNATMVPGSCALCAPRSASAGSNSRAVDARSRTTLSCAASEAEARGPPKPSPARRAAASERFNHHMPKANMIPAATMPSPGAANGVGMHL
jgi:hypothetical protein